jgi:hypothetical protein
MLDHLLPVATAVLSVFLIIATGGGLRYFGWLTREADESILRLVVHVLFPCFLFDTIVNSNTFADIRNLYYPPVVGILVVTSGMGIAFLVSRLPSRWTGLKTATMAGTFSACVGIFNYGFIPIPLVESLFDKSTLGVLCVQNLGVEISIWTLGLLLIGGKIGRDWWRQMIKGPTIAILIAIPFNLLNLGPMIPPFFAAAIELVGKAAIPVSMLLIGATIAEQIATDHPFKHPKEAIKIAFWSCLLRLGILPGLFLLIAVYLPCSLELKRVIVVHSAMPSAVFPIVLSRHYGGEPRIALQVVLSNSLLSVLTIPVWIALGMQLIR